MRILYDVARVLVWLAGSILSAQVSDPGRELNTVLLENTGGRLKLTFEFRARPEARTGNNFGRSPDLENPLFRTRIGAQFDATDWLRISAMGQDSRAPEYGQTPPATARDTMDLHQAFLEFFAKEKTGFGAIFGRQMVSLGEGRLIGVPDWLNTARTYDTARLYYRLPTRAPGSAHAVRCQGSARCVQPARVGRSRVGNLRQLLQLDSAGNR